MTLVALCWGIGVTARPVCTRGEVFNILQALEFAKTGQSHHDHDNFSMLCLLYFSRLPLAACRLSVPRPPVASLEEKRMLTFSRLFDRSRFSVEHFLNLLFIGILLDWLDWLDCEIFLR